MVNENVTISDEQAELIQRIIATGRFENVSEVVRAGVKLLEEFLADELRRKVELRTMLDEAESGGVSLRSAEEIWDAVESRYR